MAKRSTWTTSLRPGTASLKKSSRIKRETVAVEYDVPLDNHKYRLPVIRVEKPKVFIPVFLAPTARSTRSVRLKRRAQRPRSLLCRTSAQKDIEYHHRPHGKAIRSSQIIVIPAAPAATSRRALASSSRQRSATRKNRIGGHDSGSIRATVLCLASATASRRSSSFGFVTHGKITVDLKDDDPPDPTLNTLGRQPPRMVYICVTNTKSPWGFSGVNAGDVFAIPSSR